MPFKCPLIFGIKANLGDQHYLFKFIAKTGFLI